MKFAMNDGRAFTDYRSNCILNEQLQKKSNTESSQDFRKYLQKNSTSMIKNNFIAPYEIEKFPSSSCSCKK